MSRTRKDARHQAREAALQLLYQWEVAGTPIARASETFFTLQWAGVDPPADDLRRFATALAQETVDQLQTVDPLIAETAERWRPERMAVLDRLILRMAVTELLRRDATPAPVVINEALELARTFSTEDAVKFINGMLDGVRKKLDA
jgi:N utilization substance protein B